MAKPTLPKSFAGPEEYADVPFVRFLVSNPETKYAPYQFSSDEIRDLATLGYTDSLKFLVQNLPIEVDGTVVDHATDGGVLSAIEFSDQSADAVAAAISAYIEKFGYDSVEDFASVAEVVAQDVKVTEDIDVEPSFDFMSPVRPDFSSPSNIKFKIVINQRASIAVTSKSTEFDVSGEVLATFQDYVEPPEDLG
jgi:hypothetical protein